MDKHLGKFNNHNGINSLIVILDQCENSKEFLDNLEKGNYDHFFGNEYVERKNQIKLADIKYELKGTLDISRFECSRNLYESIGNLKLEEANDKRLWTYLSLYVYRKYCLARIDETISQEGLKKALFFEGVGAGPNYRNYLANLWWGVHMSIDQGNEINKYWLTEILMSRSQLFFDLSQRKTIFSNRLLVKCILVLINERSNGDKRKFDPISRNLSRYVLNHLKGKTINGLEEDELMILLNGLYEYGLKVGDIKFK